jgi:hypothetical protein
MKRYFDLAAITVLTGAVAVGAAGGCSSTESRVDVTNDSGTTPPPDASSGSSGSSGSTPVADAAPTTTTGCTQAELDAFVSYVDKNKAATFSDWKGFGRERDVS